MVQAAIEALGRVRARDAVPRLIEILGEEPWLQLAATDALGEIGDPLAAPVLVGLVPKASSPSRLWQRYGKSPPRKRPSHC